MAIERNIGQTGQDTCGEEKIRLGAAAAITQILRAGVETYDRSRDLPRLLRVFPDEIVADNANAVETIVARLERALNAERNRARSGHWTYDLNRHIALRQAYLAERRRLDELSMERRELSGPRQ